MTDCVVIVPMLGRGHLMDRLRESLAASTDRARILWVVTAGDFNVLDELHGEDHVITPPRTRGDYAHKINTGVDASEEPLIFTGAIDLHFHSGWLETATQYINAGFGVVGTNDLCNPRTANGHSTHTLLTREYAELPCIDGSPGPLHEGYWHEFVDDELCATAKARGQWTHAADVVVEHLHWTVGKRERDRIDATYRERMVFGRRLYRQRQRLWLNAQGKATPRPTLDTK